MKKIPTGVELTPYNPEYQEDPYTVLEKLREMDPVHHDTELHRYLICDYDDVKSILRDPLHLTDPHNSKPESFARHFMGNEEMEVSMLLADEPRHMRLRKLVNNPFKPTAVQRWRERIKQVVDHHLDSINGQEFDLIKEFAEPVPTIVIAEIMGIPAERQQDFKIWSSLGVEASFNPTPSPQAVKDAERGAKLLNAFFLEEIEKRRSSPTDDLISQLVAAEIDGDRLTNDEIVSQCVLLLAAGNLTTTDMIGNGIRALLENPDQLEKLRNDPSLINATVEEVLRYDSPVLNSSRITHEDTQISGCPIEKGECLHVSLAAANRDPKTYENPDKFDIERSQIPHQSFGGGRHLCLGAHLARLEGQIAILGLIQRFPDLKFSNKGFSQSFVPEFRGLEYCWLSTN